jgi:hypothetical protein
MNQDNLEVESIKASDGEGMEKGVGPKRIAFNAHDPTRF